MKVDQYKKKARTINTLSGKTSISLGGTGLNSVTEEESVVKE